MVRIPRLEVGGNGTHSRSQRRAHEDEVAAVRLLGVPVIVEAEGGRMRRMLVYQRPCVAVRGSMARERILDLAVAGVLGREVEVAAQDGVHRLRRRIES